jgi:hypothetical protein
VDVDEFRQLGHDEEVQQIDRIAARSDLSDKAGDSLRRERKARVVPSDQSAEGYGLDRRNDDPKPGEGGLPSRRVPAAQPVEDIVEAGETDGRLRRP